MGWASRANPKSRENRVIAAIAESAPLRPYQPGYLQHGDVVTLGTSATRWKVSEAEGVISLKPMR